MKKLEKDMNLEVSEANQNSMKLEQEMIKEKDAHTKQMNNLQKEIEGLKVDLSQEEKAKLIQRLNINPKQLFSISAHEPTRLDSEVDERLDLSLEERGY